MTTPTVFISYSHKDKQWKDRLVTHLEVLQQQGLLDLWDDRQIGAGENWYQEIEQAIKGASVAVMIVSANFLTSDFINKKEVPRLLERSEKEGLRILPVIVKPCAWQTVKWLARMQVRPQKGIPLSAGNDHQIEADCAAVAGDMVAIIDQLTKNRNQSKERRDRRISTGLAQKRDEINEEKKRRLAQKDQQVKVVGHPPEDVTNHIFLNRVEEQKKIGKLLATPTTRLVSVIGRGGMGKTALVSKVLNDLENTCWPHTDEDIPLDGIIYLSTRTAGISLERLFLNCAKMLGGKQEKALIAVWTDPQIGTGTKVLQLLKTLSKGLYVILMDNIEDLLNDDGEMMDDELKIFLDKSLSLPHSARLLVTSRIELNLNLEVMRFSHEVPLNEGLPTKDAITFLRELDREGDYGLRDASDELLVKIAGILHGVPLALKLFVRRLKNDWFATPEEVARQFDGSKDVIQDLIVDVYKRLGNNERRVMDGLAVFGRPVPRVAVDFLLESFASGLDVPEIANRLTRTHFVNIDRIAQTLSLHPIDQDYIYSQLPDAGDYNKKTLERCAAKYYAKLRIGKKDWQSIDDLEAQLSEFEHLVKAEDYGAAARLLNEIDDLLSKWGFSQRILNMRTMLLDKITDRKLELGNLGSLGRACLYLGKYEQAISPLRQALKISRKLKSNREEVRSLNDLSHAYQTLGEHEKAIKCSEEGHRIAKKIADQEGKWQALFRLAIVYRNMGQYAESIKYCKRALKITQTIKNQWGEGDVLENLGIAFRKSGDPKKSEEYIKQAQIIAQKVIDRKAEARNFTNIGFALIKMDKAQEAIGYATRGLDLSTEINYERYVGYASECLGLAYLTLQKHTQALEALKKALKIQCDSKNRDGEMLANEGLGDTYYQMGHSDKALEYFRQAVEIAHELNNKHLQSEYFKKIGNAQQLKKDGKKAGKTYT